MVKKSSVALSYFMHPFTINKWVQDVLCSRYKQEHDVGFTGERTQMCVGLKITHEGDNWGLSGVAG